MHLFFLILKISLHLHIARGDQIIYLIAAIFSLMVFAVLYISIVSFRHFDQLYFQKANQNRSI